MAVSWAWGGGEGQKGGKRPGVPVGENRPRIPFPPVAEQLKGAGQGEQLLENQPLPGQLQVVQGIGKVDVLIGKGQIGQAVFAPQRGGNSLLHLLQTALQDPADQAGQEVILNSPGQGVHRHDAPGVPGSVLPLKIGVGHLPAPAQALQLTAENIALAADQIFFHIGLVEKGQAHPILPVHRRGLYHVQPLAQVGQIGRLGHHGPDAHRLAQGGLGDGVKPGAVLVVSWKIVQQILRRLQAQSLQSLLPGLPHAGQLPHGCGQLHSRRLPSKVSTSVLYHRTGREARGRTGYKSQ